MRAFAAFVLAGVMTACISERMDSGDDFYAKGGLAVKSTVSEATVVTRAASVEELNEKYLHTLDVFVEHVTDGTGDGTFISQYHLTATESEPILEQVNNWLADNWKEEGLVMGQKYNVYVATNNTQTKTVKDLDEFNVAALKALVADEVTDGVAILDNDDNISWGETTTSGNVYKLYDANPGSYRALTSEKEFMMDGILENWTPSAGSNNQVFQPVTLNRAASKFVLNVKFDADFLKSLTHNKVGDDWVEKPDEEKVTIDGSPAWKFYNFAFGAPVFAPETQEAGVEVHNSGFNIFHNKGFEGDDKHFQIITYSYPNKWVQADYATSAPSLVISIGYKDASGNTNYHYYRIPLVKSTVTEIKRNHIYSINATIATRGSAAQEDQDVTEDIEYAVLPWNDQTNSDVIENHVESVQHYYFRVNPKVYTLRGDGEQSVVLNYQKASGTKVNWKLFTYDSDGNQTGVVSSDDEDAVRAWFYDADGDFTTTYSDNSGTDWTNMGVTIEQSTEGTSGSSGTVTVTSTALNNKGIKYIRLRVYLDEESTFSDGVETMYEDIIIRHFPTDNIQSYTGSWSSYSGGTTTQTLTTTDLSQAQAWATQYGVEYTTSTIDAVDYISYSEYQSHEGQEGYAMDGPTETTHTVFYNEVTSETNRQAANSQANAVADAGEGHTYYWGTNPTTVNREDDYDYRTGRPGNRTYYKYSNYYYATYTHTYSYTQYTVTYTTASTSGWVDWDAEDKSNHSDRRTKEYSYNNSNYNGFVAKVYQNGSIYEIDENYNSWGSYYSTERGDRYANLTNNHMYVIQISSTSDEYVLGRPYVDESTHQSQDDVVSPAFMIASQLGAVTAFNATQGAAYAATHCSKYMEVGTDGTRYTGWRLPTKAEISVITGYQQGNIGGVTIPSQYRVMTPVLTGKYYWSLSGEAVEALSTSTSTTKSFLRCVRDLSAEEVDRLNGFDKIQEKYR